MNYEGIIIRPPSEAESIILQVTVGCSHNKCTFCGTYKEVAFRIKEQSLVDEDIAFAARYCSNKKRVFLADGDVLSLDQEMLIDLFTRIKKNLPQVNRIALYGTGRSIRSKRLSDLIDLKKLGLARIYLGIESGDDRILAKICKSESSSSLFEAGNMVKEAGIFLSTTIILGLGGQQLSLDHARMTAALLNRIEPNQIAALTLMILDNTPLGKQVKHQTFTVLSDQEVLQELLHLLSHLQVRRSQFMANHSSNYLPISGRLARDKTDLLRAVKKAMEQRTMLVPESMRAL